jgi:hypothetical protein
MVGVCWSRDVGSVIGMSQADTRARQVDRMPGGLPVPGGGARGGNSPSALGPTHARVQRKL